MEILPYQGDTQPAGSGNLPVIAHLATLRD